jgi:peroxiredoxin
MKKHLILIAASILPACLQAADPEPLAKGDPIPEVSVSDADGDEIPLQEIITRKPTALIFYRGGWCPFCSRHLMALAEAKDDLASAGFQIVAISADQPAKIKSTPNREKLDYTLLSDSTMAAAKAFGIAFKVPDDLVERYKTRHGIDLEAASGETHHLLPHPSVFLTDQKGIIRFSHVDPDYKNRLEPEAILAAAREITGEPSGTSP